jgi:hypothetical protein
MGHARVSALAQCGAAAFMLACSGAADETEVFPGSANPLKQSHMGTLDEFAESVRELGPDGEY